MKNWHVIDKLEEHIPNIHDYISIPDGMTKYEFDMEESFKLVKEKLSGNYVCVKIRTNAFYDKPICIIPDYETNFRNTSYKDTSKSFIDRVKEIVEYFEYIKSIEEDSVRTMNLEIEMLENIARLHQKSFENHLFVYHDIKRSVKPFIAIKVGDSIYNIDLPKEKVYLGSFCKYNNPSYKPFDVDLAIPLIREMQMRKLLEG